MQKPMMKPKTNELHKYTAGSTACPTTSSVTPVPTVNLIHSTTPTTNTPTTSLLPPPPSSTTPTSCAGDGTSSSFSSASSSSLTVEGIWKVVTSWPPLKIALVAVQALDLLIALFHLLLPVVSTAYQKAVLFGDAEKYGVEGVPEAKWGPVFGHLFILLLFFVALPGAELYCTLKDLLLPLGTPSTGSTQHQYLLMFFLTARGVAIALLVYYTQTYPGYVFLLLANFAVTMILAYALFDARSKVGGGGSVSQGNKKRNSSSLFSDDALETPAHVGMLSGTEDVSPIFAAQASRIGPAATSLKLATGKDKMSKRKASVGPGPGAGSHARKSTSSTRKPAAAAAGTAPLKAFVA